MLLALLLVNTTLIIMGQIQVFYNTVTEMATGCLRMVKMDIFVLDYLSGVFIFFLIRVCVVFKGRIL